MGDIHVINIVIKLGGIRHVYAASCNSPICQPMHKLK